MATAMRVSVVIPCHNQGRFVAEAVHSARAQEDCDVEVVVVDDGSTDDTRDQIASFPAIVAVEQVRRGLSEARNAGLHASRGDCVVFLDADDRLLPGALAAGVDALTQSPDCDVAIGRYYRIDESGQPIDLPAPREVGAQHVYNRLLRSNCVGMFATAMFRRGALMSRAAFDRRLDACEDYDLLLALARRGQFFWHQAVVAEYRRHATSMSRDSVRMLCACLEVLRRQLPHVRTNRADAAALEEGINWAWDSYGRGLGVKMLPPRVGTSLRILRARSLAVFNDH